MSTTALIIEIVVIGYTALTWIGIALLAILGRDFTTFIQSMKDYKELSPLIIVFLTTFAYQFGWLLDHLSYRWFYFGWTSILKTTTDDDANNKNLGIARKWKRSIINDGDFWKEYIQVCNESQAQVHDELKIDLSIVRFTRCGFFNFIFITVSMIFYLFRNQPLSIAIYLSIPVLIIGVMIIILCFNTMKNRWRHWYMKIHEAYSEIQINSKTRN